MVRLICLGICLWFGLAGTAFASAATSLPFGQPQEALALSVEQRASETSFAALEAFGDDAEKRGDREGLNRLYHVTWTIQNQGEIDRARAWNTRLANAARVQRDARYEDIAAINALSMRYDGGDSSVVGAIDVFARRGRDWFVRAHAARVEALALIDQGRLGEGLKLLTQAQADIPDHDPYAATAQAGVWEMVGMGLKDVGDIDGATDAFRKFEVDYSNPAYPRPDFDSLYNLTKMAVRVGALNVAQRIYEAHHRAVQRSDLRNLAIYDASLCALVSDAMQTPQRTLNCFASFGEDLGDAAYLAMDILPLRAVARARLGQTAAARRDLAALQRLEVQSGVKNDTGAVEAEILFAEGNPTRAFQLLRRHTAERQLSDAKAFSAGVHQVTGDMQLQLKERRVQLETVRSNGRLQAGLLVFGVIFLICMVAVMIWQLRQGRRLKQAQAHAEAANRAKSEFLANMSHEIRTPLNGVVSMADTLSRRPLDPAEHEMVDLIRSSGHTLERLLSDILDSAKIEAGQAELETAPFDLHRTVNDVALLWRAKAEDKGVALDLQLDATTPAWVDGDAVRLRQILTNLVSNALKFTEKGAVTLAVTARADGRIGFEVRDTGVGFDAAQKSRIFQRFQQADGSITRRFGGTGLGLSISTALVGLMGGTLDCDSEPGVGSVFFFDLAMQSVEAVEPAIAAASHEMAEHGLRVLLADDHPANRKVIEIMLAATDMELTVVEDGAQAVTAFQSGGFDLVLMDMQMPVMDGLTATRTIRAFEAQHALARTPLLMLTANAMAEHVEAGRQAGADGHLTKPITLAALFAAIAEATAPTVMEEAA
ncbi:histidine kinase [Brevundimonas sp. Leaf363]|uniref:ATP-binding protein n=1 Tax=Brevundimonas sp. Leaf363 TaxID=1736353 RepID=UPI0006FFBC5A|nr:ATP-binding protein [Brevundimonas sp. Leaf363]KQS55850.1 histidine kinase [Brevundimonas sp. Leaf363]